MNNQSNVTPQNYNAQYKFCQNCGAKIDVKAVICPKCGVPVNGNNAEYNPNDKDSVWWNLLACLFPIVGLLLWTLWYKKYPKRAHGICVSSWASFGIGIMFVFLKSLLS